MQCPKCSTDNVSHASYCAACGCPLDNSQTVYKDYAGFWKRLCAVIIDTIILSVVNGIVMVVAGGAVGASLAFAGKDVTSSVVLITIVSYLFSFTSNWLYFTLMEASAKQATVGKMALGIVVTDEHGGRISFGKANVRYWSKIISSIILFVGYIMAAFTDKKQALHDIIAGTLVVDN